MNATGKIATVGTFDGCHRGHRAVIDTLLAEAASRGLQPVVLTFSNHPLDVVAPHRRPARISPTSLKSRIIRNAGVECVILEFTPSLCSLTAEKWMERLRDEMNVKALVLGYDNTFGCNGRSLTFDDYNRIGNRLGIDVIRAREVEGVSSSAIRKAVAEGDVEAAAAMLGRPFELTGRVKHGDAIGRTLGFPTANIHIDKGMLLPKNGVYAADAILPDGTTIRAVVNIGVRPSITGKSVPELRIEAHLIGWDGNLYGQPLRLIFLHRLRDEKKFPDTDTLSNAISADIQAALTV